MTVAELNSVYKASKTDANAKFKDRTLKVTGVVGKIVLREHLDIQYLLLTGPTKQAQWNVRCTFDSQQGAALRRITAGETVTVQGQYGGYEKNIILRDCAIVS